MANRAGTGTVDLGGVPVFYRHEPGRAGAPRVLFLHGGLSDSRVFDGMLSELGEAVDAWLYDRRAHGRTPDTDEPIGYASMVPEAVAFLETTIGQDAHPGVRAQPTHLVGHSDGAHLALLLALRRPDLVASVSAFSANADPSGLVLGPVTVDDLVRGAEAEYAAVSPDGVEHLPVVAEKMLAFWQAEPNLTAEDLGRIPTPVLISAGSRDLIARAHTESIAASIAGARLEIVRGSHMLVVEKPAICAALVAETIGVA